MTVDAPPSKIVRIVEFHLQQFFVFKYLSQSQFRVVAN
jgi:hypothetical protein